MPAVYDRARALVPPGGIAQVPTPEEQALIDQMKAAREPWSSYLPRIASEVGTNVVNTGYNLVTQGISPSAMFQGAVDTAGGVKRMFSGETPLWDPRDPSRPNPEAVKSSFDAAGYVTLGAGAIPAEANALRAGVSIPEKQGPLLHPLKREDGYYSKGEKVLLDFPQNAGTAEQFKAFLEKNGVKRPEIEAMGLDKLTGKVNKWELIANLTKNEPRTTEYAKSGFEENTMPGGRNYRMLNVQWANPDALRRQKPFRYDVHKLPDNTLFHALLKDDRYVGADGKAKKVLRVEELQSDWSQNSSNWAIPASPDRIEVKRVPLAEFKKVMMERLPEDERLEGTDYTDWVGMLQEKAKEAGADGYTMYRIKDGGGKWQVLGTDPDVTPELLFNETRDTYGELLKTKGSGEDIWDESPTTELEKMFYNEKYGQPPAPYVTGGSNEWVPMAAKKLLMEAARNGQDEIVIAPGAVTANRYAKREPDSKRAKGLRAFYDKVVPSNFNKVLKDLEKDSGIKGLKVEREERPFVDHGSSVYRHEEEPQYWFSNLDLREYGVDSLEHQDAVGTVFNRAVNSIQQNTGTPDEVFTELGNNYKHEVDTLTELQRQNDEVFNELMNATPKDKKEMEALMQKWDEANGRRSTYKEKLTNAQIRLEGASKARELYNWWEKNIKKQPDPSNREAWVIKLTPELRDYINKNGLPRFAKGGIVDLALHGAAA